MCIIILSESRPVARKEHDCDACEWLLNSDLPNLMLDLTLNEKKELVLARKNKWKIVKGQKYIRQNNIYDDRIYTFKAIPEINEICIKYEMYDDC